MFIARTNEGGLRSLNSEIRMESPQNKGLTKLPKSFAEVGAAGVFGALSEGGGAFEIINLQIVHCFR